MPDQFDQKKVEVRFRKFKDFASDVLSSDRNTFITRLDIFLHYCENDEVLSIITNQLKTIDVHIDEWWEEGLKTGGSFLGTCEFRLPLDETERDALLYQFSLKINSDQMNIQTFGLNFFGTRDFDEMVSVFNEAIIYPLERSIAYKLEEIATEVDDLYSECDEIPLKVFYVYQDYSTIISGDVKIKGDGVIGDGSTIEKK